MTGLNLKTKFFCGLREQVTRHRRGEKAYHKRKLNKYVLAMLLWPSLMFAQSLSLDTLTGICPQPINCANGANFLTLADADYCGCCSCHGGAIGCTGGAKGRIICQDGTVAGACACQYIIGREDNP